MNHENNATIKMVAEVLIY